MRGAATDSYGLDLGDAAARDGLGLCSRLLLRSGCRAARSAGRACGSAYAGGARSHPDAVVFTAAVRTCRTATTRRPRASDRLGVNPPSVDKRQRGRRSRNRRNAALPARAAVGRPRRSSSLGPPRRSLASREQQGAWTAGDQPSGGRAGAQDCAWIASGTEPGPPGMWMLCAGDHRGGAISIADRTRRSAPIAGRGKVPMFARTGRAALLRCRSERGRSAEGDRRRVVGFGAGLPAPCAV
jgi:hypothetical protein